MSGSTGGVAPHSAGVAQGEFWRRVLAQVLDSFWMLPVGFVLATLGMALRGWNELTSGADLLIQLILALIVLQFWATRQATPGKWALGLRIVAAEDGGPVPMRRLVVRYLGYIVSSIPLGFGFLWALFDARGQCWHDKMARTLVVRDLPPGGLAPGMPGGPKPPRFG
jgi:uncharacterized RDD family membrane protein YckC